MVVLYLLKASGIEALISASFDKVNALSSWFLSRNARSVNARPLPISVPISDSSKSPGIQTVFISSEASFIFFDWYNEIPPINTTSAATIEKSSMDLVPIFTLLRFTITPDAAISVV